MPSAGGEDEDSAGRVSKKGGQGGVNEMSGEIVKEFLAVMKERAAEEKKSAGRIRRTEGRKPRGGDADFKKGAV